MKTKLKGAITVYFTIMISALLIFCMVFVDFARIVTSEAVVKQAVQSALFSTMSSYQSDIQKKYGLFMLNKKFNEESDVVKTELEFYLKETLEHQVGLNINRFKVKSVNLQVHRTLGDYKEMKRQVLEHMKYRAPVALLTGFLEKLKIIGNLGPVVESKEKEMEASADSNHIDDQVKKITVLSNEHLTAHMSFDSSRGQLETIDLLRKKSIDYRKVFDQFQLDIAKQEPSGKTKLEELKAALDVLKNKIETVLKETPTTNELGLSTNQELIEDLENDIDAIDLLVKDSVKLTVFDWNSSIDISPDVLPQKRFKDFYQHIIKEVETSGDYNAEMLTIETVLNDWSSEEDRLEKTRQQLKTQWTEIKTLYDNLDLLTNIIARYYNSTEAIKSWISSLDTIEFKPFAEKIIIGSADGNIDRFFTSDSELTNKIGLSLMTEKGVVLLDYVDREIDELILKIENDLANAKKASDASLSEISTSIGGEGVLSDQTDQGFDQLKKKLIGYKNAIANLKKCWSAIIEPSSAYWIEVSSEKAYWDGEKNNILNGVDQNLMGRLIAKQEDYKKSSASYARLLTAYMSQTDVGFKIESQASTAPFSVDFTSIEDSYTSNLSNQNDVDETSLIVESKGAEPKFNISDMVTLMRSIFDGLAGTALNFGVGTKPEFTNSDDVSFVTYSPSARPSKSDYIKFMETLNAELALKNSGMTDAEIEAQKNDLDANADKNSLWEKLQKILVEATKMFVDIKGKVSQEEGSLYEELYINEYIMTYFSHRMSRENPGDDSGDSAVDFVKRPLDRSEVEYIIAGQSTMGLNHLAVYGQIFIMRLPCNFITLLLTTDTKDKIIFNLAAAISAWTGGISQPFFDGLITLVWASAETYVDLEKLTSYDTKTEAPGEVPVFKLPGRLNPYPERIQNGAVWYTGDLKTFADNIKSNISQALVETPSEEIIKQYTDNEIKNPEYSEEAVIEKGANLDKESGLYPMVSYEDYLRLLLLFKSNEKTLMRASDLIQFDILNNQVKNNAASQPILWKYPIYLEAEVEVEMDYLFIPEISGMFGDDKSNVFDEQKDNKKKTIKVKVMYGY